MKRTLSPIGVSLLLLLFIAAVTEDVWAQKRIFARVEPNRDATTDLLIFDVNVDPSDNISPNILFSKDGKRGYVAYAGSGTVLVFSTETGDILHRIKTEGKPQFATPLADNSTIAFVSVLGNRIFLIDTELNQHTGTYTFANALFGFGSILVLSPDGVTGYISSTGTGEVVKFNVADGRELGRMKGFQAPAQITVSRDGATLMIVDTLTEELVFADSGSLSRRATLKGRDTSGAVNFTIFNKAVLAPDGRTGIICSRDFNGILGSDTVFLFEVATGKVLDTGFLGSEPGFTGLSPDGKLWVVYNELSITLIPTDDFKNRRDVQTVRGDPLGSANIVFSPDSRYMLYAASLSDLVFQHDLVTDAVVGQVLVGDFPNEFLDQPAGMAMTPDGKVLAVIDFVSNNIELVGDISTFHVAKFISSEERFTGLSLINLSDQQTLITLFALNNFGELWDLPDINNPAEISLGPNEQISQTIAEIFRLDLSEERAGQVAIFSDQPKVAGHVSVGDTSLARIDAFPLFGERLFEWIVPEIVSVPGKTLELNFVNPNFNSALFDLSFFAADGSVRDTRNGNTAFPTNRQAQLFTDIFSLLEDVTDGYFRMMSKQGIYFTEVLEQEGSSAVVNGISVLKFDKVSKIYSPQFATIPGFKTILNIINASDDADVTVTLRSADGTVLGQPLTRRMARGEQIKEDLAVLFQDEPAAQNVTGWLEIETSIDRLLGTVTFTNDEEDFLTTFELSGKPLDRFMFPILAHDPVYQTGVALLNPGADAADVTVEVWGPGGTVDRSTSLVLEGGHRIAVYLPSLFPDMPDTLVGNIRIRSSEPLHGFSLINDRDFSFITAVPPIPLP